MQERNITWADMTAVVANPKKVVAGHSNRFNYYGVVDNRRLRITVGIDGTV